MEAVMNLQEAIKFFGTKKALAEALDIGRSAISNWGDEIPPQRQYQIQIISKGKLKATPKETTKAA